MSRLKRARCPTCHAPVRTEPDKRPADFPFCSERCRLRDLYRWFTGEYRIPVEPVGSDRDEQS